MTEQTQLSSRRRCSLAQPALYEAEAAELSETWKECRFRCGKTKAQRLWDAKNDCTAHADDVSAPETVLYLAYGSNMCAQTFLGLRKIRPLSRMNVSAPSLRLTFSLPGVAYIEPCFANADYRDQGKSEEGGNKNWDGCLVGVVYEVTKSDWRRIMSTEGGGASYREILVDCVPLAQDTSAALPESFVARTLHAPRTVNSQQRGNCSLWSRLTTGPTRSRDDYAQPSSRYINLLRTGAQEHQLPQAYRDYLDSIEPYTITHKGQRAGKVAFIVAVGPLFMMVLLLSTLLADETGKTPKLMTAAMTMASNVMWNIYDGILKPIFGDGERTVKRRDRRDGKDECEEE